MKKNLLILMALMTLGTLSSKAQTSATATCGETVVITATADPGYKFLYWADDHTNTNPVREITITADTKIEEEYIAVFGQNAAAVVVSVNDSEMGSVTGGGNYTVGEKVTLTATPSSSCYQFKEWSDHVTTATREITVDADEDNNKYQAIFEQVNFILKVGQVTGGKVTIAKK